jgi:hypothetical protein
VCWLATNPTAAATSGSYLQPRRPCQHLRQDTGIRTNCDGCGQQHLSVPVHGCGLHGACTVERSASMVVDEVSRKLPYCRTCSDYSPVATLPPLERPLFRNLLWHCYPIRGSLWTWNVEQLLRRIRLFNGRRIVCVVHDQTTESLSEVQRAFRGEIDEFILMPNVPELREVNTFEPLFSRVQSLNPSHVTFYGHSRGVTRGALTQKWTELLYEANLDYWPIVEDLFEHFPVAGPFVKMGACFVESSSLWHFSGTMFSFRNCALFNKPDWRRIDPYWYGMEPYPSLHWSLAEAGCIFWKRPAHEVNLYDHHYLHQVVLPQWEQWKTAHADRRTSV